MDKNGKKVVRTGVNVFVFNKNGQFVMGLRKGSHGEGTWGLPGGHIDFEESLEACAEREIHEETGFNISDVEFLTVTNDVFKEEKEKKHYTTNFFAAKLEGGAGNAVLKEPHKCDGWKWFTWEDVKELYEAQDAAEKADRVSEFEGEKLFLPTMNLFRQRAKLHPLEAYNAILRNENKKPVVVSAFDLLSAHHSLDECCN
ncbi:nudix hydrolase 1 [Aspergillus caelatus]|uniref:Nudix hydrolase 1 n=2 Tax=Aspergillus subgen. Circumdati TaxID=2720871 RepID=A0A5N7A2V0_9EURO|nr:nudix hydrolase 1 [Aspergillus caelatus]KAE8364211.1 nudix hydrolase 1 [Aspergillus caelatus]KAE8416709.1 nudix hydrolase 1 [Aspergillus pseudocaelatus]